MIVNNINKKEEIIYIAGKIMNEKGFEATTMLDIATEAGIKKGSLYYYFSSKEEIFLHVLNTGIDKIYDNGKIIYESDLSPPEKLGEIIKSHALHLMNSNVSIIIFFQEKNKKFIKNYKAENYLNKRKKYENFIRKIIEEGVKASYFPKEIEPKLTTLCILGMMNWLIQWFQPNGELSNEDIADYIKNLIYSFMLKNVSKDINMINHLEY